MAANPYLISGIVSGALGLGQLVGGALMKPKRPTYTMPKEIGENVQFANKLYGASTLYGMPGQGAINNQNQSALASALRAYQNSQQNPAAMLAGITATTANQQRTNADIGIKAAQNRENRMNIAASRLMGAKKDYASFKDKEFQLNEYEPYKAQAAAKSALIGGGIQNLSGGLTSIGSSRYRKLQEQAYKKSLGITDDDN
jgi:hypothetical protein